MGVAIRRANLYNVIPDFQHGNIESAASEVEYRYLLIFLFIETIRKSRGSRLINYSLYI